MEDLSSLNWYALHTKSRHEKLVKRLITAKNIEIYLPIKKILSNWADRKKLVEFPLFNGYMFVHISLLDKSKVLQTKGVIRILGNNTPEVIPEDQIETLKKFENFDIKVDPFLQFHEGAEVTIKRGPFKNCTGILVRKKNKYRMIVNIEIINHSVSVEIDANDLEN